MCGKETEYSKQRVFATRVDQLSNQMTQPTQPYFWSLEMQAHEWKLHDASRNK